MDGHLSKYLVEHLLRGGRSNFSADGARCRSETEALQPQVQDQPIPEDAHLIDWLPPQIMGAANVLLVATLSGRYSAGRPS